MTVFRAGVLAGALVMLALTLVHLRAEQARYAARILALESRRIALRRELWAAQTTIARLRAPGHLHDRMQWFDMGLAPPSEGGPAGREPRLALSQSQW